MIWLWKEREKTRGIICSLFWKKVVFQFVTSLSQCAVGRFKINQQAGLCEALFFSGILRRAEANKWIFLLQGFFLPQPPSRRGDYCRGMQILVIVAHGLPEFGTKKVIHFLYPELAGRSVPTGPILLPLLSQSKSGLQQNPFPQLKAVIFCPRQLSTLRMSKARPALDKSIVNFLSS